jgi:hypothetical protein
LDVKTELLLLLLLLALAALESGQDRDDKVI